MELPQEVVWGAPGTFGPDCLERLIPGAYTSEGSLLQCGCLQTGHGASARNSQALEVRKLGTKWVRAEKEPSLLLTKHHQVKSLIFKCFIRVHNG